jgi:hypothetical protein
VGLGFNNQYNRRTIKPGPSSAKYATRTCRIRLRSMATSTDVAAGGGSLGATIVGNVSPILIKPELVSQNRKSGNFLPPVHRLTLRRVDGKLSIPGNYRWLLCLCTDCKVRRR